MFTKEQIREHNLSVVTITGPSAAAATYHLMRRVVSTVAGTLGINTYARVTSENEVGPAMSIEYIGNEDYDLEIRLKNISTTPIDLGDRRYYATSVRWGNDELTGPLQLGLGETTLLKSVSNPSRAATALEISVGGDLNGTPVCLRKTPKAITNTVSGGLKTTNPEFRKLLNKCKGGTFCVATRNNRLGIFTGGASNPTVTALASGEYSDDTAGVTYKVIYESLYRRKLNAQGVVTLLHHNGSDCDISEFGIVDGRVYVVVSGVDFSARLLYHRTSGLQSQVVIPEVAQKTLKRQRKPQTVVEIVEALEIPITVELTDEEQARLVLWEEAHTAWVDNRNQTASKSRQLWFSHYSMMLIRRGQAPDELDIEIMSKV